MASATRTPTRSCTSRACRRSRRARVEVLLRLREVQLPVGELDRRTRAERERALQHGALLGDLERHLADQLAGDAPREADRDAGLLGGLDHQLQGAHLALVQAQ